MRRFQLEPRMLTMRGVFYPTGYMIVMFPNEEEARKAAHELVESDHSEEEISLLSPQVFQEQIARTLGNADIPLPSAGTEADTVRRFSELASQGHYGLAIHAPSSRETEEIMEILRHCRISY